MAYKSPNKKIAVVIADPSGLFNEGATFPKCQIIGHGSVPPIELGDMPNGIEFQFKEKARVPMPFKNTGRVLFYNGQLYPLDKDGYVPQDDE